MKTEKTLTPLQAAMDALETARVALIEKLTSEAADNNLTLDALRKEARDLNTKRIDLAQKMNFKEAQKISEQIHEIQAKVRECETKRAAFEISLRDAREGRAAELYGLSAKVNHETQAHRQQSMKSAEEAFLELVTDALRAAAKAISSSNPEHARRVILGAFDLNTVDGGY